MRLHRWGFVLLIPAFALAVALVGCSGDSGKTDLPKGGKPPPVTGTTPKPTGDATPIEGKGMATLKGKITYEGTPPANEDLKPEMEKKADPDKSRCLLGDTHGQLWMVGADKGVANVIVWLKAPEGKYFKVPADQMKKDLVTIDQPFCQFIPHVTAINTSVYDAQDKKQKKTGSTFKILNSSTITHNTAFHGNPLINTGDNKNLSPKNDLTVDVKPCKDGDYGKEDLVNLNCDIHKWMTAKLAVFDHPYFAVTDKDGNYEIKNAPAGAEVAVHVWHESMDPASLKRAKTKPVTLKDGANTEDFKLP